MSENPTKDPIDIELACSWSDYRKDFGASADESINARDYRYFKAGWEAHRNGGYESGALR